MERMFINEHPFLFANILNSSYLAPVILKMTCYEKMEYCFYDGNAIGQLIYAFFLQQQDDADKYPAPTFYRYGGEG